MDKRRKKNLIKLREWKKGKGFFVPCDKQNEQSWKNGKQ